MSIKANLREKSSPLLGVVRVDSGKVSKHSNEVGMSIRSSNFLTRFRESFRWRFLNRLEMASLPAGLPEKDRIGLFWGKPRYCEVHTVLFASLQRKKKDYNANIQN